MVACIQCDQRFLKNFSADTFGARLLCLKKKNLKNTRWVKAVHKLQFFFFCILTHCVWHQSFFLDHWALMFLETSDDTWILPCIPHRIGDGYFRCGAYNTKYTSTSVLDGVYPSIGRLFAFQLAYLYTTPAISSDYYFFLLLSWTMYSAIYTPCVSY